MKTYLKASVTLFLLGLLILVPITLSIHNNLPAIECSNAFSAEIIKEGTYNAVSFSPSGRILTAGGEKEIIIKETGKPAKTLSVNEEIKVISASDDSITAGTSKGSILIYSIEGKLIRQKGYPDSRIKSIAASDKYTAILFEGGRLAILNRSSWDEIKIDSGAIAIAFQGQRLYQYVQGGMLSELDPTTGKPVNTRQIERFSRAVFSANGEYIAGETKEKIKIYSVKDGTPFKESSFNFPEKEGLFALSGDGKFMVTPGCVSLIKLEDGTVSIVITLNRFPTKLNKINKHLVFELQREFLGKKHRDTSHIT